MSDVYSVDEVSVVACGAARLRCAMRKIRGISGWNIVVVDASCVIEGQGLVL